jgi:hypothetical protein
MASPLPAGTGNPHHARHRARLRVRLLALLSLPLAYTLLAYVLAPGWCRLHARSPETDGPVRVTRTSYGVEGDPVNVAVVGSRDEVVRCLTTAGWYPADPTTLRTALGICAATLRHHRYDTAPVSNLYLWSRKQDLAFERPEGGSPWQRHHVRFWRSPETGGDGRPLWVGAATFDRSVGLSRTTGQVTHHIAAAVDAERDRLLDDLRRAGCLTEVTRLEGAAPRQGHNGGGDRYTSDGSRAVAVLTGSPASLAAAAEGR